MADALQDTFKLDCQDLINSFKSHNSADFVHFIDEWKRHNFAYVFL